jgi:hypothetical protein
VSIRFHVFLCVDVLLYGVSARTTGGSSYKRPHPSLGYTGNPPALDRESERIGNPSQKFRNRARLR